ncbi:hypothetical protein N5D45_13450 [Stenotrophomonas sp. GD03819]|uniref:hypothetical protein n=1 Tax=Stenotrophomonas sp. GD03819 TaxID=2975384 RepID=UPI002449DF7D|nr:hypothetical protein [Stenotrophomonas sp. GD03819]MDH1792826.1 hypothetical protein [Stenotrophomonas sp. GD03819]
MKRIDPIVEGVIKDNMPDAEIVSEKGPIKKLGTGVRKSVNAEAMIAKWSSPAFMRSFAEADTSASRSKRHDIDVAVVDVPVKKGASRKRRQTVVVDKTSKQIIAVSG